MAESFFPAAIDIAKLIGAMGLPSEVIEGALRIGLGKFTTLNEIEQAAKILASAVSEIREVIYSQS